MASHLPAKDAMDPRAWRVAWAITGALLFVAALACDDVATPGGGASPTPTVAGATTTPRPDFDAGVVLEEFPDGAPRNEVRIENTEDLRFKARASIKMQRIKGDDVGPVNLAFAQGKCTDCQTIAVAVQVVLYQRGAHNVHPQNIALAANVGCTRCITVARAIQFVIPVGDPKEVPDNVGRLVKDMDKELRFLASVKTWDQITSDEALTRIQKVLDQYVEPKQYLLDLSSREDKDNDQKENKQEGELKAADQSPSLSPSPSAGPTQATPSASATPGSPTPSPTSTP